MKSPSPVIFTHYGMSPYLEIVLAMARASNPGVPVILLGDKDNVVLARKYGIRHECFDDYNTGPLLETFDEVYQLIQGEKHNPIKGGRDWVNFVFKRWFYINNFIQTESIGSFWHFDSDTLILAPLGEHEEKFSPYDCTEQCNGMCLNGFISRSETVVEYLETINALFSDPHYLLQQREEFQGDKAGYAFTEMRAYDYFKRESAYRPNTTRLNKIRDDVTFDEALALRQGMVMEELRPGKRIKKVFVCGDGTFRLEHKRSGTFPQVITLNMSWMPLSFYKTVYKQYKKSKGYHNPLGEMSLYQTLGQKHQTLPRKCAWALQHYRHVLQTVLLPILLKKHPRA